MVLNYEPKEVMRYFEEICGIPHGSGNTKQISDYLMDFAVKNNLDAIQDDLNNVIITKPATEDKKNSEPIIIQGHMDMVAVKEDWCDKNLETEGLDLEVNDGLISAKGTSLGGDDGIAIAYALAVLASDVISHPYITAIFTVDEETGMNGAAGIDLSEVKGKMLLNIDSEEEGIFLTSCAGGATVNGRLQVSKEERQGVAYEVKFVGFSGGHSGVEIHKGKANTNVLAARLMMEMQEIMPFSITNICGGEKDNAIAKYTDVTFVIPKEYKGEFEQKIKSFENTIKNEYGATDKDARVLFNELPEDKYFVLSMEDVIKISMIMNYIPYGVQRMSSDIEGLVQTSVNFGIVKLEGDEIKFNYSVRSSVSSEKDVCVSKIVNILEFFGGMAEKTGEYPAWEYKKDSKIREIMVESYKKLYGENPKIEAIHAGLECGILASKIEDLDCVSFGPEIYDIHTTSERMDIKSVERTWKLLLDVLESV